MATALQASVPRERQTLDVTSVYDQTSDFVWRTLQRLGVADSDLEDVLQEVYVVVHNKLHTYDGECRLTTWLFGICLRIVSRHRRRAFRHREVLVDTIPDEASGDDPEQRLTKKRALQSLQALLDRLSLEKRATFVLFEVERLSCEEIAVMMSVPIGTVHSRLHAARKEIQRALNRKDATLGLAAFPSRGAL